jgi:4-cresol dehydrogenase (hydroxylating)
LWYAPVAAASGQQVARLAEIASRTSLEHSFEPMISLTLLTPRSVHCVISISYDRDVSGADEQAMNCYRTLGSRCTENGYYPYRLGIQGMGELSRPAAYENLIHRLKATIDPNGVIAPGRYDEQRRT